MSSSCPAASENGGHDMANKQDGADMRTKQDDQRSAENVDPPAPGSRRHGGCGLFGLSSDDNGTLVVVATLITTLSYQVGSNVPGGYWQDDAPGHHRAGEPIMRTQRFWLYAVFMWSSWFGFAASMWLILALLTGVPPRSRLVRGLFIFSYSTLILSFFTQQALSISVIWVSLLLWVAAIVLITCAINSSTPPYLRRFFDWLCRERVPQTA